MSGTPETQKSLEELESSLRLVVGKNREFYSQVSGSSEPLTVQVLVEEFSDIIDQPPFQDAVSKLNWPGLTDDTPLSWGRNWFPATEEGTEQFAVALFSQPPKLNNAPVYMRALPADISSLPLVPDFSNMENATYGTTPFLLRANVIAPDLFASVRELLLSVKSKGNLNDYYAHSDDPDETLMVAMRTAYTLLGRCMRSDDSTRQYELMGMQSDVAPISDVSAKLYE